MIPNPPSTAVVLSAPPPSSVYSLREVGFASVCAYHEKHEGELWAEARGLIVSHGICPGCAKRIEQAFRLRLDARKAVRSAMQKLLNSSPSFNAVIRFV